jgi:hypothetical protein
VDYWSSESENWAGNSGQEGAASDLLDTVAPDFAVQFQVATTDVDVAAAAERPGDSDSGLEID